MGSQTALPARYFLHDLVTGGTSHNSSRQDVMTLVFWMLSFNSTKRKKRERELNNDPQIWMAQCLGTLYWWHYQITDPHIAKSKSQHSVFILFNRWADQNHLKSFFTWLPTGQHPRFSLTSKATPSLLLASPKPPTPTPNEGEPYGSILGPLIFSVNPSLYMLATSKCSSPAQNSLLNFKFIYPLLSHSLHLD